jgi:hypothetical protein
MRTAQENTRTTLLVKIPQQTIESYQTFCTFFVDFHKLITSHPGLSQSEKTVAFELQLKENYFSFQINTPGAFVAAISSLAYAHFHDLEIVEMDDVYPDTKSVQAVHEIQLERSAHFPLKTSFELQDDPYINLAALVAQLEESGEGIILQIILRPFSERWLGQLLRERLLFVRAGLHTAKLFIEKPFLEKDRINYTEEMNRKFGSKLFTVTARVLSYGKSHGRIHNNLNFLKKALAKVDNSDLNSLKLSPVPINQTPAFWSRSMSNRPLILSAEEIATLYHFPEQSLEVGNVDRVSSKRLEAPISIPKAKWLEHSTISAFATTNFRGSHVSVGIQRVDRMRHMYIIGKTGMGKTKLIQLLAIADMHGGKGVCVIDPHGDLATDLLRYVPEHRVPDVIYFNPADTEYPIGFNPLASSTPEAKHQVVMGFIGIFKKLFAGQWTNRLEHMLRFIVLALVEAGNTTVLDIVRLLTQVQFRQEIVAKLEDPVVRNFWMHEFSSWNEKFDNEAIVPIINQVGQFIANDYIRNVVAQKESRLDFVDIMENRKIVIVNLAKGKLGEENTALLGSMIITKIQEATMARVAIREADRQEFYLYVDEFQHFATEAFNNILSEARKFNLSLTIAHQYLDQLSESIRKTVFGNVGSFVSFRVGPEDAEFLTTEFRPDVNPDDFINLDAQNIYAKLSIDSKTSPPFSGTTLNLQPSLTDFTAEVIGYSRTHYGSKQIKTAEHREIDLPLDNSDIEQTTNTSFEPPLV